MGEYEIKNECDAVKSCYYLKPKCSPERVINCNGTNNETESSFSFPSRLFPMSFSTW